MTKPSLDSLEAQALRNRLDLLTLQAKTSPADSHEFYRKQMQPIAERYRELTGHHYIYADKREFD